jgi:short-subunit dehydrogenase
MRTRGPSARQVAQQAYAGLIAGKPELVAGTFDKILVFVLPFLPNSPILSWLYGMQTTRRDAP